MFDIQVPNITEGLQGWNRYYNGPRNHTPGPKGRASSTRYFGRTIIATNW